MKYLRMYENFEDDYSNIDAETLITFVKFSNIDRSWCGLECKKYSW